MRKKYLYAILCLVMTILISIPVFASPLSLKITSDKTKFKKNDEITIEVNWEQEMQAADFSLNYDANKLEYIESDVDDTFINAQEAGKIKTVWISWDDTNKTNIKYKFKVLKAGKLKFTANVEGGFADGNLDIPEKYENGQLTIGSTSIFQYILIVVAVIIIVFIIIIINKKRKTEDKK